MVCCLFCRFPVRNALRASQAVRATDVMVNANGSGDVKKPPERWLFHFLDRVERHLRHHLWLVAPEGGGPFLSRIVPIEKTNHLTIINTECDLKSVGF